MSGPTHDSSLIRDAVGGSEQALERLFGVVSPRMLATIRLMLGPQMRRRIESQDILQTTLLKAFHGIERFDGQGQGSLYGWLGAIARNEIRDQIDYQGRQKRDLKMRAGCLPYAVRPRDGGPYSGDARRHRLRPIKSNLSSNASWNT